MFVYGNVCVEQVKRMFSLERSCALEAEKLSSRGFLVFFQHTAVVVRIHSLTIRSFRLDTEWIIPFAKPISLCCEAADEKFVG